jgi:hypothetical protein
MTDSSEITGPISYTILFWRFYSLSQLLANQSQLLALSQHSQYIAKFIR